MNKKLIISIVITISFLLIDILSVFFFIVPTDYDVTTPGGLNEVRSFISIDNEFDEKGSFNTIYVYSYDKVSLCTKMLADTIPYFEVDMENNTFDLSDSERKLSGTIQKNQSIEASLIVAYEEAKKDNPSINLDYEYLGAIVYTKQKNQNDIKVGDIIYEITSGSVTYSKDDINSFVEAINNLKIGDILSFWRNGVKSSVILTESLDYDKFNRFYLYHKYNVNYETANPSFILASTNTTGPSGGLLQALSLYEEITEEDLTNGLKIAGTGTISASGNIGPIGGIAQKIVTAINNNVDVFLCPEVHYEEAFEMYNKTKGHENMRLICITGDTFSSAVEILRGIKNENN